MEKRQGAFLEVAMGEITIRFRLVDGTTMKGLSDGRANAGRIFRRKDPRGPALTFVR